MDFTELITRLTQEATGNDTHHAYRVVTFPKTSDLTRCKYPSVNRAHFFIQIGNEVADLKTQIYSYRHDPLNYRYLIIYGVLTSVKNASSLVADLDEFQRGTPIQVYCDQNFTDGVIKFASPLSLTGQPNSVMAPA